MKAQVAGTRKITKVVITRSKEGNAELARGLEAIGLKPIPIDTIEFLPPEDWAPVDARLKMLAKFDWLVFTSATGADFFANRMKVLSLAVQWPGKPAVAAVGEKTSAALQREGIKVDFVPSEYLSKALAEQLPRGRGKGILLLRADKGDPETVPSLERSGFRVTDLAIYRTFAEGGRGATEADLGGADAVVFASPSAVEAFMKRLDSARTATALTKRMPAFCIGPVTAAAAREQGFERVITAKVHTVDGLVQELRRAAAQSEAT